MCPLQPGVIATGVFLSYAHNSSSDKQTLVGEHKQQAAQHVNAQQGTRLLSATDFIIYSHSLKSWRLPSTQVSTKYLHVLGNRWFLRKKEITMFDYINKDLLLILAFSFSSIITDNHHNHLFTKKVTCNIACHYKIVSFQSTEQAWGVCDTMWKPQWPRCTKQLELKSLKTRDSYYVITVLTTLLRENFYIVEVVRKDCHLQAAIIQRFLLSHPLQLHHHLLEQKDPTEFWQIFKREIWLQNREIQKSLPSADHHLSHQWKYP